MGKNRTTRFEIDTHLDVNRTHHIPHGAAVFGFLLMLSLFYGESLVDVSITQITKDRWEIVVLQDIGDDPTSHAPDCANFFSSIFNYTLSDKFKIMSWLEFTFPNKLLPAPKDPMLLSAIFIIHHTIKAQNLFARITILGRTEQKPGKTPENRPVKDFIPALQRRLELLKLQRPKPYIFLTSGTEVLQSKTSLVLGENHSFSDALLTAICLILFENQTSGMKTCDLFLESRAKGLLSLNQAETSAATLDIMHMTDSLGNLALTRIAFTRGIRVHGFEGVSLIMPPALSHLKDFTQKRNLEYRLEQTNVTAARYIKAVTKNYTSEQRYIVICGALHCTNTENATSHRIDIAMQSLLDIPYALPSIDSTSAEMLGKKTPPANFLGLTTKINLITDLNNVLHNTDPTLVKKKTLLYYNSTIYPNFMPKSPTVLQQESNRKLISTFMPVMTTFFSNLDINTNDSPTYTNALIENCKPRDLDNFLKLISILASSGKFTDEARAISEDEKWQEYMKNRDPDEF